MSHWGRYGLFYLYMDPLCETVVVSDEDMSQIPSLLMAIAYI